MATTFTDVRSISPQEAVELAFSGDADQGGDADLTLNQEEVEIELPRPEELQQRVRYTLPKKIAGLKFPRETETEHEVADVIRRRYQKRFNQSFDEVDPSEAFRMLKQNETTRMLSWESQVEECVEGESDDFWTQVSKYVGMAIVCVSG